MSTDVHSISSFVHSIVEHLEDLCPAFDDADKKAMLEVAAKVYESKISAESIRAALHVTLESMRK